MLRVEVLLATGKADDAIAELKRPLPATPEFTELRARQKLRMGHASRVKGQCAAAEQPLEEARRMAADAGLPGIAAEAETIHGACLLGQKKPAEAEAVLRQAIEHARQSGDTYLESGALINLGFVRQSQYRYDEAAAIFQRLADVTQAQARAQYPFALVNLSVCLARLGEFEKRSMRAQGHRAAGGVERASGSARGAWRSRQHLFAEG